MRKLDYLLFGTSNIHKYKEIKTIFDKSTSIQVKHASISPLEIQSDDLEVIAKFSLDSCVKKIKKCPLFVEDSGLFITSLNGFPGPYSAYVFKTIGNKGIMKILEGEKDRRAYFQSTLALSLEEETLIFTAVVDGKISNEISHSGWGYDPIFIPDSNPAFTFGDLGDEKMWISHRYFATKKMITYLEKLFN
jgi:XTP/dITP diphosphohydrolase